MNTKYIVTTYPYEDSSPGIARYQCQECGAWERSDKRDGKLRHSKRCESQPQPLPVQAAEMERLANNAKQLSSDLANLARNVRRTGMTQGRDDDVVAAVMAGYLSVSDAMNTDD